MKRPGKFLAVLLPLVILVSIVSFISLHAIAGETETTGVYTLEESIREALEKNWSIKAQEEKIEESMFAEKQAKSDFLPTLSTSYGYTRLGEVNRSEATPFSPARDLNSKDNYKWTTTISQPLFTGYALTSAHELAKLGIDQSSIGLELEKLDLVLEVKTAYFTILKAEKAMDVAKSEVESLKSHLKVARNFYEVGMIPVNDLLKAEVEMANSQHNYIKAENASLFSRSAFNVLLARPIERPVEVKDILVFKPEHPDFNEYLNKALGKRPEVKALDIRDLQIDQQIVLAKSRRYPEIAVTYNYTKEGDDPDVSGSAFHDSSTWQAILGLSWTIWDWDKTNNSVRQNESLKKQLAQTRKSLENSIALELNRAILNLQEAEKNIPTAKKAVVQAEENLRVSQERYKAQVTTSTEVLDAQTLLSQARTNYYNALYAHNLAKAGLMRAIGEY